MDSMIQVNNAAFLNAIMPSMEDGEYGWIHHMEGNPRADGARWKGHPIDAWADAPDRPGLNSYFCVAVLKGTDKRSGTSAEQVRCRRKSTFSRLVAVVIDDGGPIPGLEPTWILRTSIKDGKPNHQVGYRLLEPVENVGVASRLHHALANAGRIAKDSNGNNPVRYVRLPTGSNGKYDPPHPHVLERFEPECMVSLADFCMAAGFDLASILGDGSKARRLSGGGGTASAPAPLEGDLGDLAGGMGPARDWDKHARKIAMDAARRTHDDPSLGRHKEIVTLGGHACRDGVPRKHLEFALEIFAAHMRPTDTSGVVKGIDWETELKAIHDGYNAEAANPTPRKERPHQERAGSSDVASIIEAENRQFFVAIEGGHVRVCRLGTDPEFGHETISYLNEKGYRLLRANETITVIRQRGDKREEVQLPLADVWIKHPQRRTYPNGIALLPGKEAPHGVYNLWRGLAIEAQAPTNNEHVLPLGHLKHVVCGGNQEAFDYLVRWMARAVQRPDLPAEVAVVMRGNQGTGKGTAGRWLLDIFGRHHAMQILQSRHLTGNFNAHLRSCLFLFADEAFFAGDRAGSEVLKGLITEPSITIEKKGVDVFSVPNRLKIMMATNNDWCVPAGIDERRYLVLDVSDRHKQDHAYFTKLNQHMECGGLANLLHFLLHLDLSDFNVRAVPTTRGLTDQKIMSLSPILAWIYERLYAGHLRQHAEQWDEVVVREQVAEEFAQWVRQKGDRYTRTSSKAVGDGLRKAMTVADGGQVLAGSRRVRAWKLPPLEEARRQFESRILSGANVDWEDAQ